LKTPVKEERMRITTHFKGTDVERAFELYVERRLRFALGRFGGRVGQVTVRVGADGRTLNECRISTEVLPFGHVSVEESDPDLFAALDRATGRIGRVFGRELGRARDSRMGRESVRTAA
jgi:putative sigma-54 modulation protein